LSHFATNRLYTTTHHTLLPELTMRPTRLATTALPLLTLAVFGCPGAEPEPDLDATPDAAADASQDAGHDATEHADLGAPDAHTPDAPADDADEVGDAGLVDAHSEDAGPQEDAGVEPTRRPMFVGVSSWGYRASSQDGATWHELGDPPGGDDHTPNLLRAVGFGQGTFIAVGGDRNAMVMRSTDGETWQEDLHTTGNQWMGGVAWGDGVWVAAGGVGQNMRSTDDGLTWTLNEARLPGAARAVGFGDGAFVAVGDGGMIAVSRDGGVSWTDRSPGGVNLGSVAWGADTWVALGSRWNGGGFDTQCVTSTDAVTWSPCPLTSERFRSVTAADGRLVVSMDGAIAHTTDGATWTRVDGDFPGRLGHSLGAWVGESSGRRWRSTALDSGWTSERFERGFRDMATGWVTD
jgi:hypothetical protein